MSLASSSDFIEPSSTGASDAVSPDARCLTYCWLPCSRLTRQGICEASAARAVPTSSCSYYCSGNPNRVSTISVDTSSDFIGPPSPGAVWHSQPRCQMFLFLFLVSYPTPGQPGNVSLRLQLHMLFLVQLLVTTRKSMPHLPQEPHF